MRSIDWTPERLAIMADYMAGKISRAEAAHRCKLSLRQISSRASHTQARNKPGFTAARKAAIAAALPDVGSDR